MHADIYWHHQQKITYSAKLRGEKTADVIVVGGGVAGLSAASQLAQAGKSVILLEKDFCGAGASGQSSGFVTPDSEIEIGALVAHHGAAKAKKLWSFVLSGVEMIRQNIKEHHLQCDYHVQDCFFIANSRKGVASVRQEHEARTRLGYPSSFYDQQKTQTVVGSTGYYAGVRYPGTFGLNAFEYCQDMKKVLLSMGVKIYEQSKVETISEGLVTTDSGRARAKKIIVCADRFIPDFKRMEKEIYHIQTFLGISKPLSDKNCKKIFPADNLMVWDTSLVYNYFRMTGQNRLLIGGGDLIYTYARDFSDNTPRFAKRLEAYIHQKFPTVPFQLDFVWPGMLGVSKDLLPIMGPDPKSKNIWFVGAATGLPWAAALGTYLADKVLTGRKEFDQTFSWQRKFPLGRSVQTLLTTPVTYAASHGLVKSFK